MRTGIIRCEYPKAIRMIRRCLGRLREGHHRYSRRERARHVTLEILAIRASKVRTQRAAFRGIVGEVFPPAGTALPHVSRNCKDWSGEDGDNSRTESVLGWLSIGKMGKNGRLSQRSRSRVIVEGVHGREETRSSGVSIPRVLAGPAPYMSAGCGTSGVDANGVACVALAADP
ncbi:hypothetical protein BU16DRAFT_95746 [Lophium mytilinum]|uniref:Uncharacterized protein n=1 Tax=Lophium mytilinum TaxID=390894 RepID=A0A6A6QLJ7_9PEZI|nr:hypothetical protein BU16DRAFT_95746 [Lophium mytilinum]